MGLPEADLAVRRRAVAIAEEVLTALHREEAIVAVPPEVVRAVDRPADEVRPLQPAGILHTDVMLTDLLAPVCSRHSLTVHRQEAPQGASCSPKNRERKGGKGVSSVECLN